MQILMLPQTLAPLDRNQVSAELVRITPGGRLDAADVDRAMLALTFSRAELYGTERLDANETALLTQALEFMRARTADIIRPEFKGRSLVPFTSEVDPGADSWSYQQWDRVGMAKIVANYSDDIPKVATFAKKFSYSLETITLAYEWTWLDMLRSTRAAVPLRSRKASAVRDGFEQRLELLAATGIEGTAVTGLLNNVNVPVITVAPGATGSNHYWAAGSTKTPQEIVDDLHAMEDAVITNTKGTIKPDTLVLPLVQYRYLNKVPFSTAAGADPKDTILKVFLEKSGGITDVFWWEPSRTANAGQSRALMYKRDAQVVHCEVPMEQQEMPPQAKNLAMEVISVGRIGGVAWEYPLGGIYMNGVGTTQS
jgi:hypothetical protein